MEYSELKNLLIKASDSYYKDNISLMSDEDFDIKMKELEEMEANQGYRDNDSPTIRPGSDLSTINLENAHKRPCLSLENTYNDEDVEKWFSDMQKATGMEFPEVVVNPKWDGNSGCLRYNKDGLYKALTRGDGLVGEDITNNVKYCQDNVWAQKKCYGLPFLGEARGEIIMTKAGFEKLNENGNYQNARNLVSGSLKLLNIYDFIPRSEYIMFYAYWLEDSEYAKYSEDLTMLKRYGFEVGPYYVCNNLKEIKEAIEKIHNLDLPVSIDGAVLKLNNKSYWEKLGSTAKYPKWAVAYKYKQETAETKITNIEFWVGRTGKITPVAFFEPKFIDGSLIQKATLNNEDFYKKMNVAIGDEIEVQKAAAIIPQIVSVKNRPKNRKIVEFPKVCPCCGSTLRKHNEEQNDYFCDNEECKSRIVDKIVNFTHSIECDGFAEVLVERLHENNYLNSISDLYKLQEKKTEIAKLERFSKAIIEKLCKNIETTKKTEFWKVLAGLSIPGVGPKTAKILSEHFKNIGALSTATIEELIKVNDIAEITATSIHNWFDKNITLINELKVAGLNMSASSEEKTELFKGKKFCITGTLSKPRTEFVEIIEKNGGSVMSSVTKNTSYLLTNDKETQTAKNKSAKLLKIPIINEEEFLNMLK